MQNRAPVIPALLAGLCVGLLLGYLFFQSRVNELQHRLSAMEQQLSSDRLPRQVAEGPGEENGNLLFKDTFDDNVNNWDTQLKNYGMKILYDGKYIIDYRREGYFWWSGMPLKKQVMNYDVVLKARHKSGTQQGYYGLLMTTDTINYYRFCLTNNGYASINVKQNDKWQPDMVRYLAGYKAAGTNTDEDLLELKVRGIRFTFYANGKKVHTGTLSTNENWKNVGMFVEDVQTVEFDELTVSEAD
ncbi:hypothetical protein C7N43_12225 [Sphingobacteriales bacterium UPWRP_1]|nr:hypothetical protein B6N25_13910 [Sphingobacteriales bacterium TSM_CSS]PSJ76709.1 hypothetical protein C7N43_12225 [Sphingobacteriales bacterium UPWRP_1]